MPSSDSNGTSGDAFTALMLDGEAREHAAAVLREHGMLRLARLGGRDEVLLTAGRLMSSLWRHRDADPDGLTVIRDTGRHDGRPGFAGLGREALALHTECAQHPAPPRLLLLACARAGDAGGETLLVDGQAVLTELAAYHPVVIEALAADRAAYFGGSGGLFAPVLQRLPDGRWRLRLRQDDFARFSPDAEAHLAALRQTLDRNTQRVRLAPGQGVVLDNHRLLHGRTAFSGERLMLRALGEPHPELGLSPGYPAPWSASHPATARTTIQPTGSLSDQLPTTAEPNADTRPGRPTVSW
ncbi:TauD/TfdA family dioxygenase [Kitasatospora sp. NPDC096204]|uniref:TauD/TfdA family dioxygenase n=1 Tax=Kitasatospora sp. NPDC096204 TaxID=3364094 RepID=UPI0038193544